MGAKSTEVMPVGLKLAIAEAKKIRANLLRFGDFGPYLEGACGLASLMLAHRLQDVFSLRIIDNGNCSHVFNVINGTIIDITATQFSQSFFGPCPGAPKRGVYVSKKPLSVHRPVAGSGMYVYRWIVQDWHYGHRTWDRITNSWIQL